MSHPSERSSEVQGRKVVADPDQTEAWELYMDAWRAYIKRQAIVYQNWPQRKWEPTGLRDEPVFTDQNN